MKKFLLIITALSWLMMNSIVASAEYQFDANYYARKYPDVVEALGTDVEALSMHYRMYGIKEGRFANQQEEIDSMLPGYTRPNVAPNENPEPVVTAQPDTISVEPSAQPDTISVEQTTVSILPGMCTYVDVNIAAQTMTYFENGEIKLQSPCVTGNVNRGDGTPCGTFSIINKVPGKYLIGPTWKCWVNRWMQFTSDHIGLHDATWRKSFGDNIYQTDGSHGCVNLPNDVAASLYDMVSIGTTVVVH